MPISLRSEPRVVIHPPSPPDDHAVAPARPPRPAHKSMVAVGSGMGPEAALARDEFLRTLQREKRRADRSRAPLSLVLYEIADGDRSPRGNAFRLLDAISASKRETDVLGFTGPDSLAILFPDTPEEGARRFVAKIAAQGFEHGVTTIAATYPDCLFDELANAVQNGAAAATGFNASLAPLAASPAAPASREAGGSDGYFLKRGLDVIGALIALVLVSPLLIATAIAIAISSPGPIIFRQKRLGKGGKPFVFYKFRSMRCDADDSIHRQYVASLITGQHRSDEAGAPAEPGTNVYKITADPRVFGVGRIIRKTSIDELPQLFNVLRGEMSLVGPRPALPYEAENYQSWHLRRIWAIRPGITGLWQVEGRSRVPFDEMVRMDLRYIRHCSLALDLKILVKTVRVVLRCEGAV
ncbi:MAG TPA: sugar transferase [Ideonella sp.]|nr:sugar transferase [Ideonella sp.]